MENRPVKRINEIVQHELDRELLIYDLLSHKAYCLNETAAIVWHACDGKNSVEDISKQLGSEDLVWLALDELKKQELIEHDAAKPAKLDGLTRREAVMRLGLSTVFALPVVAGLVVPAAGQAASVCGRACGNNNQCGPPCPVCVNPGGGGNGACAAA